MDRIAAMKPSLWTSMFYPIPAVQQAAELAAAGFEYAELSCESVVDPETQQFSLRHAGRLRRAYDEVGVRLRQVHYPLATLNPAAQGGTAIERAADLAHPDEARREFELRCADELLGLCPVLGIEVMVVHPGGYLGWHDQAELAAIQARNAQVLRALAPAAARNGVIIAVENMARYGKHTSYCADFGQLIALVDDVGSPNVGICLDTSHANVMKADIPAGIRRMGERIVATHISDNLGAHDDHLFPFGGRIQWQPIVEALREVGYARLFNLEVPGENRCPPEIVRLKAQYARELLGRMLA